MKDIVEEALECNVPQDASNSVSSDEFGPPQFLYVGIGTRGIKRLRSGLPPSGARSGPEQAIEDVVTKVAFLPDSDRSSDESDQIDQYVDSVKSLAELNTDIDCCLITADIDNKSVITDILAAADAIQDSLTIVLLSTSSTDHVDIEHQIHESVGTTVLIEDSDSHFDTIESPSEWTSLSADRLVQRLAMDFVTLCVGPNPVSVDYARVRTQWSGGRSAVPFVGKFHQSELEDTDYLSAISFVGPSAQRSIDWFGYAWIGPSFILADFEQFRESLDNTLRSNTANRRGVLGCGISEQLENSLFVSGVQFVDSISKS